MYGRIWIYVMIWKEMKVLTEWTAQGKLDLLCCAYGDAVRSQMIQNVKNQAKEGRFYFTRK